MSAYDPLRELRLPTGFRHRFADIFADITRALEPQQLVIFIDDLDRCQPQNVVATLEMINFLVSSGDCFIVMGLARDWVEACIGLHYKELAGDEKFFDLLDETLADSSAEATERLKVFYTCLGLGFCGWYAGQPEYLRGKVSDIAARLRTGEMQSGQDRISPEAYQYVDTRDLIQPRLSRLGGLALVFIGLCLIVTTVEIYLFRAAVLNITGTTGAIATLDPRSARPR